MSTLVVFGLTLLAVIILVITLHCSGISVWQFLRDVYWPFGGADYFEVMEQIRRETPPDRQTKKDRTPPSAPLAPPTPASVGGPPPAPLAVVSSPDRRPEPAAVRESSPRPAETSPIPPKPARPSNAPIELPAPLVGGVETLAVARRRHTAIVGVTGDGKTTCSYTLLVRDLAEGCQCVVVSRHFSPYHEEDQRIDLRPIAHLFEAYRTTTDIRAALDRVAAIIDDRLDHYYTNRAIGHPLIVYLGEWRSLRRLLGTRANKILEKILDEGRKVKVWAVVEMHSALIAYMGSDSGTREAFGTCLVGNVDPVSWKTLMGSRPHYAVPLGYWATEHGIIQITPPSSATIANLAQRPAPTWERLLPASPHAVASPSTPTDESPPSPIPQSVDPFLPPNTSASAAVHPEVLRALARIETVEELSRLLLLANGGQRTKVRRLVRGDNAVLSELLNRLTDELGLG